MEAGRKLLVYAQAQSPRVVVCVVASTALYRSLPQSRALSMSAAVARGAAAGACLCFISPTHTLSLSELLRELQIAFLL